MSIINRNYFVNKNKHESADRKLKRRAKVYWNVSCPKCGDPKESNSASINRFSPTKSRKLKCRVCSELIYG